MTQDRDIFLRRRKRFKIGRLANLRSTGNVSVSPLANCGALTNVESKRGKPACLPTEEPDRWENRDQLNGSERPAVASLSHQLIRALPNPHFLKNS